MDLAEACYKISKSFPRDEAFGLTSQIRRAATSMSANIAEGYGRESRGSFVPFLRIAQGSLKELETHLLISARIGILVERELHDLLATCEENGKMLRSLIRVVQRKQASEQVE